MRVPNVRELFPTVGHTCPDKTTAESSQPQDQPHELAPTLLRVEHLATGIASPSRSDLNPSGD